MKKFQLVSAVVMLLGWTLPSAAYDTGSMTCHDIGQFASATMQAREQGKTKEESLAVVAGQDFKYPVEKSNLTSVVKLIYGRVGDQLAGPQAAYNVVKRDCDIGSAQ